MPETKSAQFITDEVEWTLVPDLVVLDVAYKYTGLRDKDGHKILRRISRPVGFTANLDAPQGYVVDHDERIEPEGMDYGGEAIHEGSEVEGE